MRSVLVLLAALALPVHAALSISFEPASPSPADEIVVTIRDSSPTCPSIIPSATRFDAPSTIRIAYRRIGDCGFAPFSESKTTIGPLPWGTYTLAVGIDSSAITPPPGPEATTPLVVSHPAANVPDENYAGHYTTGPFSAEGVFIEQFGGKAFLTLATYDSEGRPSWYVMPDARSAFNATRNRFEFTGTMYRTRRGPESPPSIAVISVGTGVWYPTGFDTLRLETTIDGIGSRNLTRFRF